MGGNPGHDVAPAVAAVAAIRAAVGSLAGLDPVTIHNSDLLEVLAEMECIHAQWEACRLRVLAEADTRGAAQ